MNVVGHRQTFLNYSIQLKINESVMAVLEKNKYLYIEDHYSSPSLGESEEDYLRTTLGKGGVGQRTRWIFRPITAGSRLCVYRNGKVI